MRLEPLISTGCVTVAELKRHIADWPETDASGEPTEVWLQTGDRLSRPCVAVEVLNLRRVNHDEESSDLLFSYK